MRIQVFCPTTDSTEHPSQHFPYVQKVNIMWNYLNFMA